MTEGTVDGVVMQGTSAEIIANKWDISREDMDAFAVESHRRAAAATAEGRFDNEIIAVAEKRFDRAGLDVEDCATGFEFTGSGSELGRVFTDQLEGDGVAADTETGAEAQ